MITTTFIRKANASRWILPRFPDGASAIDAPQYLDASGATIQTNDTATNLSSYIFIITL
jgi:hypothetical protein